MSSLVCLAIVDGGTRLFLFVSTAVLSADLLLFFTRGKLATIVQDGASNNENSAQVALLLFALNMLGAGCIWAYATC